MENEHLDEGEVIKKKRGRRKKVVEELPENIEIFIEEREPEEAEPHVPKKRGRKPKGGKIIQQVVPINNQKIERPNVILHLKCSMKDLQVTNGSSCLIESFNFASKTDLSYELLNGSDNKQHSTPYFSKFVFIILIFTFSLQHSLQ